MKTVLSTLILLSALGLALSLVVHGASWFGIRVPPIATGLHVGVFVVWIPAVVVVSRRAKDVPPREFWRTVFERVPRWMTYMVYALFVYAILNFSLFALQGMPARPAGDNSPSTLRAFSGHWMLFYAAALAMLYAGTRVDPG